jgi:hypothetical protein
MTPASPTDKASASLLSGVLLLLLLHLMLSDDVLDRSSTNSISAKMEAEEGY